MADVMTDIPSNRSLQTTELDGLVIGAGFAGLYQLLCLRDRLGLSVRALEAGGGVVAPGIGTVIQGRDAIPKAMSIGTRFLPS
jgi:hypothetical protein